MFRPYGATSEHSLVSCLLLQLLELGGRKLNWLPQSSKALFAQALLKRRAKSKALDCNCNALGSGLNQVHQMITAAIMTAAAKLAASWSYRVAMRLQSLRRQTMRPMRLRWR